MRRPPDPSSRSEGASVPPLTGRLLVRTPATSRGSVRQGRTRRDQESGWDRLGLAAALRHRLRLEREAPANSPGAELGNSKVLALRSGGEGGIRTLEGLAPLTVFETARFSRSRTSPPACLHELAGLQQVPGEDAAATSATTCARTARDAAFRPRHSKIMSSPTRAPTPLTSTASSHVRPPESSTLRFSQPPL